MGFNVSIKDDVIHHIHDSALPKYYLRLKETINKEQERYLKKFYFKTYDDIFEIKTGKKVEDIYISLKFQNGLTYTYNYHIHGLHIYYSHENLEESTFYFNDLLFDDVFEPHQKLLKHIKVIERTFTFDYEK